MVALILTLGILTWLFLNGRLLFFALSACSLLYYFFLAFLSQDLIKIIFLIFHWLTLPSFFFHNPFGFLHFAYFFFVFSLKRVPSFGASF